MLTSGLSWTTVEKMILARELFLTGYFSFQYSQKCEFLKTKTVLQFSSPCIRHVTHNQRTKLINLIWC